MHIGTVEALIGTNWEEILDGEEFSTQVQTETALWVGNVYPRSEPEGFHHMQNT